jgi:hypothetical protein
MDFTSLVTCGRHRRPPLLHFEVAFRRYQSVFPQPGASMGWGSLDGRNPKMNLNLDTNQAERCRADQNPNETNNTRSQLCKLRSRSFLALIRPVLHAVHRLLQHSQTHRAIHIRFSSQEWQGYF